MIRIKNISNAFFAVCLLIPFGFVSQSSAQDLNISVQANRSLPQANLAGSENNIGLGFDSAVGYKIPKSPLFLGVNFSYQSFETNLKPKSDAPGVNILELNGQTINRILATHLYAQVEPTSGIIIPFFGALTGISYPFIENSVESNNVMFSNPEITSFNSISSTVNVGFFSGIKVKFYDSNNLLQNKKSEWYLKLKIKYLVGPEAFYLKQEITENEVTLVRSSSRVNFINLGIGITAHIN